jgi:hypothetical protein
LPGACLSAARLVFHGDERPLLLEEVEAVLASDAVVVDACRYVVRDARTSVPLGTCPVLFALARCLGEAWPNDVSRGTLLARAFGAKYTDESHRARLRVEIGRLRSALRTIADANATQEGFLLVPRRATEIVVLARLCPAASCLGWNPMAPASFSAGAETAGRCEPSVALSEVPKHTGFEVFPFCFGLRRIQVREQPNLRAKDLKFGAIGRKSSRSS